jgi:hypothetical protein
VHVNVQAASTAGAEVQYSGVCGAISSSSTNITSAASGTSEAAAGASTGSNSSWPRISMQVTSVATAHVHTAQESLTLHL